MKCWKDEFRFKRDFEFTADSNDGKSKAISIKA